MINSALVVGLLTAELEQDSKTVVLLSPRGHERARALAEKFPNRVQIGGSNQDVVDANEVLFVAVLPSQVKPLLESLTFRQGQHWGSENRHSTNNAPCASSTAARG